MSVRSLKTADHLTRQDGADEADRVPRASGRALARRWWIPLIIAAIAVGAAAWLTSRQAPVYRASTMLAVAPTSAVESTSDILRSLETLERRTLIATFARIPPTPEARAAIASLLPDHAGAIGRYRIEASVLPNTNIVKIDVEGDDAALAADIANAAADVTTTEARRIYRIYTMKPLAKATPPNRPLYPDPRRNYLGAGVAGLFLGLVVAAVISYLDPTRKTS